MNESLKGAIAESALSLGFDAVGFTEASRPDHFDRYVDWLDRGYAAGMGHMEEAGRRRARSDPSVLLTGATSAIVVAASYAPSELPGSDACFARFTFGLDYHYVILSRLRKLVRIVGELAPGELFRAFVDTGPVLERSLAQRSGIGWIGKNACLIRPDLGSYFCLGVVLTTLYLERDAPALSRCGSCTLCLDACPTGALLEPFVVDARKCIAYHTLESRSASIPSPVAAKLDGRVAGCDACQEVCPWNSGVRPARLCEFSPRPHVRLTLDEINRLTPQGFRELFEGTGLKRLGLGNLMRNARATGPQSARCGISV